jgi:head-tail adaptor
MPAPKAGDLDRRITFQAKGAEVDPDSNTAIAGGWDAIAVAPTVWAQVQDVMPSRAESSGDVAESSRLPARIRCRWRGDIDSAMRIVVDDGRVMQIVAGPAEIFGRRTWMEFMAEEYSSAEDAV